MASAKCSIDGCKRNSDNTCDHCQAPVCMKHYIEHVKLFNAELPVLSEQLNDVINVVRQHNFTQHVFEQIEQWRVASHQRIEQLYEEKKQLMKVEVEEKIEEQMKELRVLSREIEELIEGGDASFNQIETIRKSILECREHCKQLTNNDHFHIDVKTIHLETTLLKQDLFTGGGTLLSQEHQLKLNEFYGKQSQAWMLVYKATRDGFPSGDFHRLCNNQGPTMTIVQSREGPFLFGGYTSASWDTRQSYVADENDSFIFTLTNPNSIPSTKYPVKLPKHAIYDHLNYGPTFGAGHDMYISSHSHTNKNSSFNFPHSYTDTTKRGPLTFTGSKNFQANEVEVYRLVQA